MMPNQNNQIDMNQFINLKHKPRRSFTALEKLAILSEVSQTGFNATQRKYKIQGTQITKWRKRIEELKKLTEKSSRASRVVSKQTDSKYPELENWVYRQYLETINQTGKITNSQLQNWAKEIARSQDMKDFYGEDLKLARFGQVWLNSFKKKFNITITSNNSSLLPIHQTINIQNNSPGGLVNNQSNSIVIGAIGSTGVNNNGSNLSPNFNNLSNSLSHNNLNHSIPSIPSINMVNSSSNVNNVVSIGHIWPGTLQNHSMNTSISPHIRSIHHSQIHSSNHSNNSSMTLMDLHMGNNNRMSGVVIDGSMSSFVNMRNNTTNTETVSNLEYHTDGTNSSDELSSHFID